ncbi:efflux RND transporter periplasmic adaptor subunit [Chelatococcus reniformis]|uniref:Cation efflux system protein n=1 Tax=Chelatococcus reniformis TaxID=1494448 RepID=A0A916UEE0_9HYPH|nr:efflux RND transporter periplasmic adaptor subunit [Chelatococcus reniformis]GGC68856.1 cation efflux system protein [Chelatococcus reniformis]
MTRSAWLAGTLAALGAGGIGYGLGQQGSPLTDMPAYMRALITTGRPAGHETPAAPIPRGPVIYYQHPDGRPTYSLRPRRTADGRDFRAVHSAEDASFEPAEEGRAADTPSAGPTAGDARRVLYYRNPMGLPDTSPVPKKDSMGMDYLPVYEGEDSDGPTVKISPGKVQRTGVRSEPVTLRVISRPVRVPGTLQLDERRVTVVATRAEAFVNRVANVTTGDRVRRDQPLVDVYSPEINAAAAQLIANPGFDGSRRRLQNLNVPADAITDIERTRKVPMAVTWSAPRDGVILERTAIEGMKAAAGDALFRIGDVSVLWVLADVPEHEMGSVQAGQPVTVRVRALPGRAFASKISMIYPQVNKDTRTARVRVELPNPDGALLPDMYADVEIATGPGSPVVAVPDDAVIDTGVRQVVLLDEGDGRFAQREVQMGSRGNGFVEIRSGIAAGDRVVTSANFLLDAESNLKAALRSLAAQPASTRAATR